MVEVGIVGLPGSGKSTLFQALTGAEPEAGTNKPNVGMASMQDARLDGVAAIERSKKVTAAALRVLDAAGTSAAQLGTLRRSDALLAVLDAFSGASDPAADRVALELELLLADRDHVERRLERARKEAKSGDPSRKEEVTRLEAALANLEAERPLSSFSEELPAELDPLTTKPLVVVENGPGAIDAKLEVELADLPPEEAEQFREGPRALDEILRRLGSELDLITFFTGGDTESRAWTLRRGQTALEAAAAVHTDIARGFVRCEVIRADDLIACGSRAEAARRGLQRLEGKNYVVEDGDVLNIRFTPPR